MNIKKALKRAKIKTTINSKGGVDIDFELYKFKANVSTSKDGVEIKTGRNSEEKR